MTEALVIQTLGGLTVHRDGTPIDDFDQRKVPALLVYLACTGRPQRREVLAELFWESRTQAQSLSNLRVALSNLRKTVGPFVNITRETVGMQPDSNWWLDAAAFEQSVVDAGDDPVRQESAVALYQGDFLEGFYIDSQGFEDWMRLERERLRFRGIEALDRLIVRYLAAQDYVSGIRQATRLLQLDPLREETHRLLIELLSRSGQRAAALKQYEMLRQMLDAELSVEPAPQTVTLYKRLLSGNLVQTVERPRIEAPPPVFDLPRHNLPAQATSFVGRESDITTIIERLANTDCRLLTLTGPGGIGKSRLALKVAERLVGEFAHGVFFVPLAPLTSPDDIVSAIATAVQFRFYQSQDSAEQQLLNFLREKEMLLVLDNFEHLLHGAGPVASLLTAAPSVTVLVTTHEPLNLGWEWLYDVQGMMHPATPDVDILEDYGAVRLFVERARRVQPDFRLAAEHASVVRICQLVEGMPLGIEIAAACLRILPCDVIAAELMDLETLRHDMPQRHHSLRALFDHTWQRLTPPEQDAFMKLSVFRGGFSREAAEAVAQTTLPRLATLVNKSLLQCDRDSGRYSIHELLRQYAAQQLEASAKDQEDIRTRHAEYFADYLSERYVAIRSGNQSELLPEIDNLRAAWDWMIEHLNLPAIRRAMRSLFYFYWRQGLHPQGEDAFAHALNALQNPTTMEHKGICGALTVMHAILSNFRSELTAIDGVALLRETDLREELAWAQALAVWGPWAGHEAEVRSLYESSLTIYSELNDRWGIACCLYGLGRIPLFHSPRFEEGRQYLMEALGIFQELGDRMGTADTLQMLAVMSQVLGHYDDAWQHYAACLELARLLDNRREIGRCLNGMACLAMDDGQPEKAQELAQQAVAVAKALGDRPLQFLTLDTLADTYYQKADYAVAKRLYDEARVLAEQLFVQPALPFEKLGDVARATGDYALARRYYYLALKRLHDSIDLPSIVVCLVHVALFYASQGMGERTLDILGVTIPRPALNKHRRDETRLHAELEAEFGLEAVEAAIERGKDRDPLELAREVLVELEQAIQVSSDSRRT